MFDPQTKLDGRGNTTTTSGAVTSESPTCNCTGPVVAHPGISLLRWPMKNASGPLQFWRLSRRLELKRGHGRLLIHGNGYWK